ncbi:MAG: DUF6320 domain-containing protein [Christensenellales bacterium]|jgi:hypothetical protein
MKIEPAYPAVQKSRLAAERLRYILRWCFSVASYVCVIVNLCVGGVAWSLVVLWSLWCVWSIFVSPSLVEYNRISQTSKSLMDVCVLLILIDTILSSGWAHFVVPIVSFGSLIVIGVLFLSDLPKQKHNMMPMVWLIAASFVAVIGSLIGWPQMGWPMIVLGSTALLLLLVCIAVLRQDLLRELKKRFHTK